MFDDAPLWLFFVWFLIIIANPMMQKYFKSRRDSKREKLETDLRSVDMELLAVEAGARFSADGEDVPISIKANFHSMGMENEQIRNVIIQNKWNVVASIFEIIGNQYDPLSDTSSSEEKRLTGIAVHSEIFQAPNFVIGKNLIKPLGFLPIELSTHPKWLLNKAKIYSRMSNANKVTKWVNEHQNVIAIVEDPTFLMMQFHQNTIEVYYQVEMSAELASFEQLNQKVDIIIRSTQLNGSDSNLDVQIKMLKDEEKKK